MLAEGVSGYRWLLSSGHLVYTARRAPLLSKSNIFFLKSQRNIIRPLQTALTASGGNGPEFLEGDSPNKGQKPLESGLYLVATPIGNLEDITLRALRILKSADLVLSEDTRHSGKLLQNYNISSPLMSYHKFNESSRQETILQRLQQGQIIALISDAGTPGISDPGAKIVKECVKQKFRIYPIPGPSAVIAALTASGLPTNEFSFIGFLPPHSTTRKEKLMAAAKDRGTQVLYVAPHKLLSYLEDIVTEFGEERQCVIAREMTKWHEEFWRGTLKEAMLEFSQRSPKGEITLVIHGDEDGPDVVPTEAELECELRTLLSKGHSVSEGVKLVSMRFPVKKKSVYSLALKIFSSKQNTS